MSRLTTRSLMIMLVVAGVTTAGGTAAGGITVVGSTTAAVRPVRPPGNTSLRISGNLFGVAATSARNAWAVGSAHHRTLILHWNGTSWAKVPSPGHGGLVSVAATSASNAWAVGSAPASAEGSRPLILHWNGHSWATVPSPHPAGGELFGVAAASAGNAWAVGQFGGDPVKILSLHWDGTAWQRVPSPVVHLTGQPGFANLTSVATAGGRTWAAGEVFYSPGHDRELILRWTGQAWEQVPTGQAMTAASGLDGIAAASARSAWTVGCACSGGPNGGDGPDGGVAGRWDGTSWRHVAIPVPAVGGELNAVTATPAGGAWATGIYCASHCRTAPVIKVLILRWTGSGWQKVPNPAPGNGFLDGMAATSATSAWAVGGTGSDHTLILHWNGRTWS